MVKQREILSDAHRCAPGAFLRSCSPARVVAAGSSSPGAEFTSVRARFHPCQPVPPAALAPSERQRVLEQAAGPQCRVVGKLVKRARAQLLQVLAEDTVQVKSLWYLLAASKWDTTH